MAPRFKKEIGWLHKDKYGNLPDPAAIPEKDIKRILSGEPIDYVVGWKPFLNCVIDLSKRPLIPRPETEYWTEQFINAYRDMDNGKRKLRILDIFAGSGCIGIAILKNLPNAQVDFADYDPRCIAQIKINLKKNGITPSRARIIRSDVFNDIPTFCRILECRYDAIVANPPYVPGKNRKLLPKTVLNFEPHIAVFGGSDGLHYIRIFLRDAKKYLKSDGSPPHLIGRRTDTNIRFIGCGGEIWMEFDTKEKSAIAILAKRFGYAKCEFKKDQYGKIRYAILSV